MDALAQFHEVAAAIGSAEPSQMFGKPCYKTNGKAFVCFFQDCMVFKLSGESHEMATELPGSVLFDPSGKGRAMKEWVQVRPEESQQWSLLATAAFEYVSS